MREIVRNSEEYLWGSREHGPQFLGTCELSKSEFRATPFNLFLRDKGTTVNFYREQGNMPPRPPREALINRPCHGFRRHLDELANA